MCELLWSKLVWITQQKGSFVAVDVNGQVGCALNTEGSI